MSTPLQPNCGCISVAPDHATTGEHLLRLGSNPSVVTGIVFFQTEQRGRLVEFYRDRLGLTEWLDQPGGCTILQFETLLVGFCEASTTETEGIITLVVDDRDAVDDRYAALRDVADDPPRRNDDFDIYQFFLEDPDGRTVEIQTFCHDHPADR